MSTSELIFYYKNRLEDLRLTEKNAILNIGMDLEAYESLDFYRFNEIMLAKEKEDREVDPMEFAKSLGFGGE